MAPKRERQQKGSGASLKLGPPSVLVLGDYAFAIEQGSLGGLSDI